MALIIGISVFYYLKIFIMDQMLFFVPLEEQRRLPNNFDVYSEEDGNPSSVMTISKAALLRENNNPGFIIERLPNSVPFRRLIFHEST